MHSIELPKSSSIINLLNIALFKTSFFSPRYGNRNVVVFPRIRFQSPVLLQHIVCLNLEVL